MLRRILLRRKNEIGQSLVCHVKDGLDEQTREEYRQACKKLDFYAEFEGKRYCVLHFPGEDKEDHLERVLESKLDKGDYDFRGTVFPEGTADFKGLAFEENADFRGVIFDGAANFLGAQFSGEIDFTLAEFDSMTAFGSMIGTTFAEFSRPGAVTGRVVFTAVALRKPMYFRGTTTNLVFSENSWAQFDYLRVDNPELLMFRSVLLHPGWFINADVGKVDFTDVKWYGMPGGLKGRLDEEIAALEKHDVEPPHTLLSQACQRLSANAEENREYPLANEFHYWSLDALRKEDSRPFGLIRTMYWALSGYGVRAARAFWALVV